MSYVQEDAYDRHQKNRSQPADPKPIGQPPKELLQPKLGRYLQTIRHRVPEQQRGVGARHPHSIRLELRSGVTELERLAKQTPYILAR